MRFDDRLANSLKHHYLQGFLSLEPGIYATMGLTIARLWGLNVAEACAA